MWFEDEAIKPPEEEAVVVGADEATTVETTRGLEDEDEDEDIK